MKRNLISAIIFAILFTALTAAAQTTEFTYQGSLKNGAEHANGFYDFEFRLYNAETGGFIVAGPIVHLGVNVQDGIFTVSLDFGPVFTGGNRYLDIRLQPTGGASFTSLSPRTAFRSAPYAIKSLSADNSAQLGGVEAGQYVQTTDPRLTDARPPTGGSPDYVQNQNAAPQAAANFSISGTGRASGYDASNVEEGYRLGGNRFIFSRSGNVYVGRDAGISTFSSGNTFVGFESGKNTNASGNTFMGSSTGNVNTSGSYNTFLGAYAGRSNTTGDNNVIVGSRLAGQTHKNTTGNNNTIIGGGADVSTGTLNFATAIGSGAIADQSNSIFLGRPGGEDAVRIPGAVIINGSIVVDTLGTTNTNTHLCRNTANRIAGCTTNFAEQSEVQDLKSELDRQKQLVDEQAKLISGLIETVCRLDANAEVCSARK